MTNVERVRELCQQLNVPISKMENDLGFGNGYLNPKKIKDIKTERLMMILDYLGVSIEEFWDLGSKKTQKIKTSLAQIKKESPEVYESIMDSWVKYSPMIDKYKELDSHGAKIVDTVLDLEYARCVGGVQKKPTKIIPLFPAAAGPGEPVDGEAFDDYEVPEDSKAAFAVRISGDSMEPEFHHGDVVLCEKRIAKDGEIAVIMVNGCLLVKQYIPDSFGNIYLRSLNRNRKDLDVDILASGNYTVQGWGTVIHKRIPLVEQ